MRPQVLLHLLGAQIPRLVYTDLYRCVFLGPEREKLMKKEGTVEK